jgi:hypothetical protein
VILEVIFVVFMIFWFLGGGYTSYRENAFNPVVFGTGTLIPWACVAILGWVLFGGNSPPMR